MFMPPAALYKTLYHPSSDDECDRWQRDAVMREVQQILEDMT